MILAPLRRQGKVDQNVNNDIGNQEVIHRFGHVDGAVFHTEENGHDCKNKGHVTCNRQIIVINLHYLLYAQMHVRTPVRK